MCGIFGRMKSTSRYSNPTVSSDWFVPILATPERDDQVFVTNSRPIGLRGRGLATLQKMAPIKKEKTCRPARVAGLSRLSWFSFLSDEAGVATTAVFHIRSVQFLTSTDP